MKILFGIQTTGNGHLSRAQEILPELMKMGHVTVLLSGEKKTVQLPCHQQIQKQGLTYTFGKNGRISIPKTAQNLKMAQFLQDVHDLDLSAYDLILNDFEPISAWAAKRQQRHCFSLSHQYAFTSEHTPRPTKQNDIVEILLKYFAPCSSGIGFHFDRYDHFILPPVIKQSIKELDISWSHHFSVYLPAYQPDFLIKTFKRHSDIEWQIFSPQVKFSKRESNVLIQPTSKEAFAKSICSAQGIVTAGGFELCAEAMYLGKKLFSIPVFNQYEQRCNTEALKLLGIHSTLEIGPQFDAKLIRWIDEAPIVKLREAASISEIMEQIHRFMDKTHSSQMVA